MSLHLGRCIRAGGRRIEGYANRFILDRIAGDHNARHRDHAVDVDAGGTGGSSVFAISAVAADAIADDRIVSERNGRRSGRRGMIMHGYSGKTVTH